MCAVCVNCGKCQGKTRPGMARGYCPLCKHQNPAESKTCENCGAPLPQPPGKPGPDTKLY